MLGFGDEIADSSRTRDFEATAEGVFTHGGREKGKLTATFKTAWF
jgi:hypothetical protein